MSEFEKVGEFQIKSGYIKVSDPCYDPGSEHYAAKNGTWQACVRMSDEGSWGNRVASLKAVHESFNGQLSKSGRAVGVDSGQMSISDGDEYPHLPTDLYDSVCQITNPAGIVENFAVASSTGYGDGAYDLFIAREDNQVVGVEIEFIREPSICSSCGCTFEYEEDPEEDLCRSCYDDEYESSDCDGCGMRYLTEELYMGLCEDCQEEDDE